MEYQSMRQTYASKFSSDCPRFERIMAVIDARMSTVMSGTDMPTACALNPYVQYSLGTSQTVMAVMRNGLEKMLNTNSAAIALQEFEIFRTKQGEFSSDIARYLSYQQKLSIRFASSTYLIYFT